MANPSCHQDPLQPHTPSDSTSVDLHYPQILLQASFTSLLSTSVPSLSNSRLAAMPASESPERSLSESWASLSNSEFGLDDDIRSENTDIASLVDTNASEDLQSNDEEEQDDHDECGDAHPATDVDASTCSPTPLHVSTTKVDDFKAYDNLPIAVNTSSPPDTIKFEEVPPSPMTGRVDLRRSMRIFSDYDREEFTKSIPRAANASQLVGTIRMTTFKSSIRRDRPFRLLYSGPQQAVETRAEILRKIGDVLVADSPAEYQNYMDASRYHVIPSEFGPGASPNYAELVPLVFQQMIVDECVNATAFKQDSAHCQIMLNYKSAEPATSIWDGNRYLVPRSRRWNPPDLAILVVREDDESSEQLSTGLMNEFMQRHHIPTIVIRDATTWSTFHDHVVLDRHSLHMCIESRPAISPNGGILQLLPIDISSFLNLDAGQLNRHFACLGSIHQEHAEMDKGKFVERTLSRLQARKDLSDVEKNLSKSIVAQNRAREIFDEFPILQVFIGLVLVLLGFAICKPVIGILAAYLADGASTTSIAPSTTTQLNRPVISILTTTSVVGASIVGTLSTSSPQTKPSIVGLSAPHVDTGLARLISNAVAEGVNKSDNFQVQMVGDSHVVVKVPQRLLQKRKAPKIKIMVTRGSIEVPSNTSKLFDGLYTVKIERKDASGLLNLTITTSKPVMTEIHELDFGKGSSPTDPWTNMLKQAGLLSMAQTNISRADVQAALKKGLLAAHENLEALTITVMRKAKNLSAEYGPLLRSTTLHTQVKSKDMYAESVRQARIAVNELARNTNMALRELGSYSREAGERGLSLGGRFLSSMKTKGLDLRDSASRVDLGEIREKVLDCARSEPLAKAQDRARQIAQDTVGKVKEYRERGRKTLHKDMEKQRKGMKKPKEAKGSKKGGWHSNVRVNWRRP